MRLDSEVARKKFESEVETLERHSIGLRQRGCWIFKTEFPIIDVVLVPKHPVQLLTPMAVPAGPGGLSIVLKQNPLPFLSSRPFGVRIGLDDFDQRAPSVSFRDPWTWEPLDYATNPNCFNGYHIDDQNRKVPVLLIHPKSKLPFLCMRGIREYHEHPQHTGDDWMLYRGKMGVFGLLFNILDACIDRVKPSLILQGLGIACSMMPGE
ncbi:MAG: hypothetical protein M1398_04005 [Deltaproteobacteria bacterium]|nr:hypothetical protein [Deltaproteobacteria bacterium]